MDYQIDYDLLNKYCNADLCVRIQGTLETISRQTVTIVNTGMVNSGKSSLFNVLTEHYDREYFQTGAARTTKQADSLEFQGLEYVDTPGIDICDTDDNVAFQTVAAANVILVVHNIRTGPLTREESSWLQKICQNLTPQETGDKLIFVCSWCDSIRNKDELAYIVDEVKRMVFEITEYPVTVLCVSSKRYLSGVQKNKPELCDASGIPKLRSIIQQKASLCQINSIQMKHLYEMVQDAKNQMLNEKQTRANCCQIIQKEVDRTYIIKKKSWDSVYSTFKHFREKLAELNLEYNNM